MGVVGGEHVGGRKGGLTQDDRANLEEISEVPEDSKVWKLIGWAIPLLIVGSILGIAMTQGAEAAGEEIEALCKAGDKAGALSKGLELSRELQSDATLKKVQECSKGIGEMMGGMFETQMKEIRGLQNEGTPTETDICS